MQETREMHGRRKVARQPQSRLSRPTWRVIDATTPTRWPRAADGETDYSSKTLAILIQ